jgi:hypothetical protein
MKDYAIAPDADEIAAFQGEFQFHPCQNDQPGQLRGDQLETFNRDGYLTRLPVFTTDEIAVHRAYFDELLAAELARGGTSYSISTAHLKYGPVYDLLCHPRIVSYVRDLLGNDVIGWGSHFFCKLPGDGQDVAWHQDADYWPLSATKTVTVWLAVDNADRDNGCMRVIAGSHRQGRLRHADAERSSVLDRTIVDPETLGEIVDIELDAGQASIHSDLLVHGSLPNDSQRRRCGLTLRYCPPDVRAGMDWHEKGVVVSGSDAHGNWANPARAPG